MGLMISELLSGVAPTPTGSNGATRAPEATVAGTTSADEFAARLAAMVQQLRRNGTPDDATAQRQEFAAAQPALSPAGLTVLAHGATPGTAQPALATGAPATLATFTLGPTLQAITPASDLPDAASLQAFARSQGLDERAVQWLLGQPPARTASGAQSADRLFDPLSAATAPGTPPIQHNTAMPTDDSRLKVLAEEVIELLRTMLGQMQPAIAPPTAATSATPNAATMVAAGLTAPATTAGTGLSIEAATANNATALLQAALSANDSPPGQAATLSPVGLVVTDGADADAGVAEALRAALSAARSLAGATTPLPSQNRPAAPAGQQAITPAAPAPSQSMPLPATGQGNTSAVATADVKQALLQLIAALAQRTANTADTSVLAGKSHAATPSADAQQPLGHQAMVFVRAVTQLQRSQAASAPPPAAMPKPAGLHKPLELEVDLTDAWIGDEFDPLDNNIAQGVRPQAPLTDATPTARVLAQWQQGRHIAPTAQPTAAAADASSPAADGSQPAPALPAHAHPGLQPVGTPDDLLRGRPATNSVQAASPGSDTGGYKPQDPDRGRQLADKMGEAVGQRMLQALERGDWSLKLAMKPANLGHIEVNMRMNAAGLDAQFTASQAQTRDLLADGLQRLRDTLVQMGMDVAQLNVGGDRSQKRGGDSTPRQAAAAKSVAGVETTEETDAKNQPTLTRLRNAAGWDVMV